MVAERVRGIGRKGRRIGSDRGVEHGVAGIVVLGIGGARPRHGCVVLAQHLALPPAQLAREEMAGDAAAGAPHDLLGQTDQLRQPGDKRVTGRRNAL